MNYQSDYALLQILSLIKRALYEPYIEYAVKMEPRNISLEGFATAWDIALMPDDYLVEVKLNPTKADFFDWLDNARETASRFPSRKYRLICGKASLAWLKALGRLKGLAIEANGDDNALRQLVSHEKQQNLSDTLARLGQQPSALLQRLEIQHWPEEVIATCIEAEATSLAGRDGGQALRRFLFDKIERAVPNRATLSIMELIQEAETEHIPLNCPPDTSSYGISLHAKATLVILQVCPDGIPLEVLAKSVDCNPDVLKRDLAAQIEGNVIRVENDLWSLAPRPCPFPLANQYNNLAAALRELLAYVHYHRKSDLARKQVTNVVQLAEECAPSHPALVAEVFTCLNSLLKRTGIRILSGRLPNSLLKLLGAVRGQWKS
jgi:hypothetical protein